MLNEIKEANDRLTKDRVFYDIQLNNYVNARKSSSFNQKPPKEKEPYKSPAQKAWEKMYEEKQKAQKERDEWMKNHQSKKPFSDPIFKKKH